MNVQEQDLIRVRQEAASQSTANSRTSAMARLLLVHHEHVVTPLRTMTQDGVELDSARIEKLEAALGTLEVPDVEALEGTISTLTARAEAADAAVVKLTARLDALEKDLGAGPAEDGPTDDTKEKPKRARK